MTILKLLCVTSLILTAVLSLPIDRTVQNEVRVDILSGIEADAVKEETINHDVKNKTGNTNKLQRTNQIRPGMIVTKYEVEITPNFGNGEFQGILRAQISITDQDTRDSELMLYARGLTINSVSFAFVGGSEFTPASFSVDDDDGTLEINTGFEATIYSFIIEYSGSLTSVGQGLFAGSYDNNDYLAMNLYATNARRVFPCLDEPNQPSLINFIFNGIDFNHIVMNSAPMDNAPTSFMPLQGPPLLWSMAAHNLNNINSPTSNVLLFIRPGVSNQESQASIAINYFVNNLNDWTNLNYFDIMPNQNPQLHILALPDISRHWFGLSSVGIWEPYVLMENTCSAKQRFAALSKIGEELARQWFGYVVYPENFRFHWVVSGLASYAGFDLLREFQTGNDISMLDINTLFVTEIIQESLLRDSYLSASVMEPGASIFDEDAIRNHLNGVVNYKAPAIMRMLRLVLGGPNNDFIQSAGKALIAGRGFQQPQAVNTLNFVDAVNSDWVHNGNGAIENVEEYLAPFIQQNGYPVLNVQWRQGGVSVSMERFRYMQSSSSNYEIPITYTVSNNPNYDDSQVYPIRMLDGTDSLDMFLDEEDYVIFNIQGQGYYRVHYDSILWERMIEALGDPDRRAQIHPLNRASLLDDVLNLARGGRIDYETAFLVTLTWEHETEYAPWKAFVRNMNFLRKHLVAMVSEDEDLDQDIYLRMVRRTIGAFENELGFIPGSQTDESAMTALTRGLVMDHACRANYQPCIAAALDWFYDTNSNDNVVNPNIPSDIRPAVFCTAVREGGSEVINALLDRLEIEPNMWERVVILESLACSTNADYINGLLMETISESISYTTEERNRIFIAIAESSYENLQIALNFLSTRVIEVRRWYGGDERLENVIHALAENVADAGVADQFINFVNSQFNNLDDSQLSANQAADIVRENINWENQYMQFVYDWIDENDAPTLMVSFTLMLVSCFVALFNH